MQLLIHVIKALWLFVALFSKSWQVLLHTVTSYLSSLSDTDLRRSACPTSLPASNHPAQLCVLLRLSKIPHPAYCHSLTAVLKGYAGLFQPIILLSEVTGEKERENVVQQGPHCTETHFQFQSQARCPVQLALAAGLLFCVCCTKFSCSFLYQRAEYCCKCHTMIHFQKYFSGIKFRGWCRVHATF